MSVQLPFGINAATGEEFAAGKASRFASWRCPYCNRPVILKRGKVNQAHFAHKGPACDGVPESPIHKLCKELLAVNPGKTVRLESGALFSYEQAEVECPVGNRFVDVLLHGENGSTLAAEIVYCNDLTGEKLDELHRHGHPVLAIFVESLDVGMEKAELLRRLTEDLTIRMDHPVDTEEPPAEDTGRGWQIEPWALLAGFLIAAAFLYKLLKSKSRKKQSRRRGKR